MLSGQEQAPAEVKPEAEEKKEEKAEEKKEEKPEEQKEEPKPPLPFVLFVDLHCVGCAKKIERSLMKIRALSLSLTLFLPVHVNIVHSQLSHSSLITWFFVIVVIIYRSQGGYDWYGSKPGDYKGNSWTTSCVQ